VFHSKTQLTSYCSPAALWGSGYVIEHQLPPELIRQSQEIFVPAPAAPKLPACIAQLAPHTAISGISAFVHAQ
jgi:hypothetical protein